MKLVHSLMLLLGITSSMALAIAPGAVAPDFSLKDATGKTVSLGNYKGKHIVLEWYNKGCPFVKKHYGSNNMQNLQKEFTQQGVTWLTIVSSAEGKQGYLSGKDAAAEYQGAGMASTALLLDPEGEVGRKYGAKTTPHMFIIDPQGKIIYTGAIDDNPSADPADIKGATNYIRTGLASALGGKPLATAKTNPYGCSVKYK